VSRRRRSVPRTPGDVLDGLLEAIAPEDAEDLGLARIQRAWSSSVGPAIAAAARPVAVVDGVLHVACEEATWAHEIQMLEATVVARIRDAGFADVRAIRARSGGSGTGPRPRR
jgi:predicted nucleic acid-binding Zn ribbon protein